MRQEMQHAETAYYERIGVRDPRRKEGRHSDVLYVDTPHSRRANTMSDFYDADMVDQEDKLRVIMNLESSYAQAMGMGFGRQIDREIIAAALGSARGGKKGDVIIPLPNTQKIASVASTAALDTAGTGNALTLKGLRKVKLKMKQAEAVDDYQPIIYVCTAKQIDDLLATTEVTSADYNTVKALVQGEVDTFMGFKFVRTELLPFEAAAVVYNKDTGVVTGTTATGADGTIPAGAGRRTFAFTANEAIICALPRLFNGKITEIPTKHYAYQVYGACTVGCTRMDEVKVVELICKET